MERKPETIRKIYNKKRLFKIDKKIKLLGSNTKMTAYYFMNSRLITSIIFFFVVLYIFDLGFFIAPVLTFAYFVLFERILLDNRVKRRSSKLEGEAMHFFEVLTLSLETGRNLEEAINVTVYSVKSELSQQFAESVREVKYGKSLTESLTDMQEKIPSEAINNIILTITQANMFGNSIIDTLYNQIDYLRDKRTMEVKSIISKIPIKISIISVLFFVPLILLIILAPVLLSYIS